MSTVSSQSSRARSLPVRLPNYPRYEALRHGESDSLDLYSEVGDSASVVGGNSYRSRSSVGLKTVIIFWHWRKRFETNQPLEHIFVTKIYDISPNLKPHESADVKDLGKIYGSFFLVYDVFEPFVRAWLNREYKKYKNKKNKLYWDSRENLTMPGEVQVYFSRPTNFWNWFWGEDEYTQNPFFPIPPTHFIRQTMSPNADPGRLQGRSSTKYFVLPIYEGKAWFKGVQQLFRCRNHRRWRQVYKDLDVEKNAAVVLHRFRVVLRWGAHMFSYGIYVVQRNPAHKKEGEKYNPPSKGSLSPVLRGRAAFKGEGDEREEIDLWLKKDYDKWGSQTKGKHIKNKVGMLLHISQKQDNEDMMVLYAFCQFVGLQFFQDEDGVLEYN